MTFKTVATGVHPANQQRHKADDLIRGVDFFPKAWDIDDMQRYARRNLALTDACTIALPAGPALDFCQMPWLWLWLIS